MKIIKIDKFISVTDDVLLLSQNMCGFEKFASNNPIQKTLTDLAKLLGGNMAWALCGGLAVGVRVKPRGTEDVDIVIENDAIIDNVVNLTKSLFRHNRFHALVHKQTGVEVDLITPEFVKVDSAIVLTAINTATDTTLSDIVVPTVTQEGLIALKLGRGSTQDIADVESVVKRYKNVNLSQYNLGEKEKKLLEKIKKKVSGEVVHNEKEII